MTAYLIINTHTFQPFYAIYSRLLSPSEKEQLPQKPPASPEGRPQPSPYQGSPSTSSKTWQGWETEGVGVAEDIRSGGQRYSFPSTPRLKPWPQHYYYYSACYLDSLGLKIKLSLVPYVSFTQSSEGLNHLRNINERCCFSSWKDASVIFTQLFYAI